MRSRILATLAVACLSAFLVGGCGDDSDGKATGGNSTKELASDPGSGRSDDAGSESDSGSDDVDDTLPDFGDVSIPDMDDFGDLGDCMSQATAYASLAMSALGGKDSAETAEKAIEEMKSALPADLADDIEVLGEAYRKVAEDGIIEGGEAMDTPEFEKADKAVSDYFEKTCGGGEG